MILLTMPQMKALAAPFLCRVPFPALEHKRCHKLAFWMPSFAAAKSASSLACFFSPYLVIDQSQHVLRSPISDRGGGKVTFGCEVILPHAVPLKSEHP